MSKVLKSTVLPELNPMSKLIGYSQTPQVTGLEYREVREIKKRIANHPENIPYYEQVIEGIVNMRQRMDRAM